jgi:integrase
MIMLWPVRDGCSIGNQGPFTPDRIDQPPHWPAGSSPGAGRPALLHVSKPRKRKVKPWTAEEARQFLESAKRDRDLLSAAYVLILVLGLRKGEVIALAWGAVNLDEAELDIGWQLQRVRGQLLRRETRTEASDATLPLPGICVNALTCAPGWPCASFGTPRST